MTRSVRTLGLVALLPALCACSTFSAWRSSRNLVSLHFAWPENYSARVSYSFTSSSSLGDNEVHRRYWLTVEPASDKGIHLLVPHDMEVFPPELTAMVDPVPIIRFDDKGVFKAADIPEDSPGQQLLEALPLDPEKKAEIVKNLVASQQKSAREYWDRLVGTWLGAALIPGEPLRYDSKMVVGAGMAEKKEVPAEEVYTLEAGVPCTPDAQERRCVRLTVKTQPVGQSETETGPMAYWSFELVTEPDTLVPYFTRLTRKDRVDWSKDGGPPSLKEFKQVEEFVYTYGLQRVPSGLTPL